MKKQYFKDNYGNTASITKTEDGYKLICRNYYGRMWKKSIHVSAKAAKSALLRTGGNWFTTSGHVM